MLSLYFTIIATNNTHNEKYNQIGEGKNHTTNHTILHTYNAPQYTIYKQSKGILTNLVIILLLYYAVSIIDNILKDSSKY